MHNRLHLRQMMRSRTRRKRVALRPIPPSSSTEIAYRRALTAFLRGIAEVLRERVLPAAAEVRREVLGDAATDRLEGAMGLLREAVQFRLGRAAEEMVERILGLEFERHTERFKQSVKSAVSIDLQNVISRADLQTEFDLALQRNVALIRGMANDTLKRIETRVSSSVIGGRGHENLATQLESELGVMRSRADLIARDQTAKLSSDLNRLRQEQVGVEEYEWSTSRDERVRPEHEVLEGMRCRWDDPSQYREGPDDEWRSRSSLGGVELHPGEDIQCRCVAIAILEAPDADEEAEAA